MYTLRWSTIVSGLVVVSGSAQAAELPVPCIAGSCGSATTFVTSGGATAVTSGNTLNVNQTTSFAILNWQSFNISRDGTVNFQQPDVSSVALNRIYQNDPSRIFGALNANGRVYLLNQNGILFGATAKVNVGALVASSLDITPEAVERGIAGAINDAKPAFQRFKDAGGQDLPSGAVTVEAGATIDAPSGQVLLFAPEIVNRGTIRTPDGQTMLAAGDRVYLATSTDSNLRGLLVEVGGDGSVTNGEDANSARAPANQVGVLTADRGNVTIAGMLVRQSGQVSATTSTRANGSIRLLARSVASLGGTSAGAIRQENAADVGGELTLTNNSRTAVTLDTAGTDETVDVNTQPLSRVQLSGKNIGVGAGSEVIATGGVIEAAASATPGKPASEQVHRTPDDSSLVIASGARLDVSGAHTSLAMERNVIRVELRGNQLADSPMQREGTLRSEPVFVDVRRYGTRSDGSSWQGTPLADVSGDISNIRRGVAERNLNGGQIDLRSSGTVVVGKDAKLDVSGGAIDWQSGYINTSKVLGADGRTYDISNADRDRDYVKLLDPRIVTDRRWGVTEKVSVQGVNPLGKFEAGYVEGRDAGTVSINAPRMAIDGDVVGATQAGRYQRRAPITSGTRTFDVLPRAATLVLGDPSRINPDLVPDLVLPDLEFTGGFVVPEGVRLGDALPENLDVVRIRPDLLGAGRIGNLTATVNGTVHIGPGNPLTLPAFGSIAVTAGHVDIAANIAAPSGRIAFSAVNTETATAGTPETPRHTLNVAPGVTLSTTGTWVNDEMRLNPGGATAPLAIDGGSISLSAVSGTLDVAEGAVLDVSAGAQRRADGSIRDGAGGSIALTTTSPLATTPSDIEIGGTLRGFALSRGGSLSVSATSVCITSSDCTLDDPDLTLTPDWFRSGGFGSISLTSNLGDLIVADDTTLTLRQRNLELLSTSVGAPTGTAMQSLTREVELADPLRRAQNLSLTAGFRSGITRGTGDLRLGQRSAINADPLATVAMRTNSSAFINGTVRAPGGNISVLVDNTNVRGYSATQGMWLGASASLSVAGTSIFTPAVNQLKGSVLAGGTVSLTAQRGFIVTEQDSLIDVSGTSALLDVGTNMDRLQRRTVASAGGTLNVTAAESILLNGSLSGESGAPGRVAGGTLNVQLDANQRNFTFTDNNGFPSGDRSILMAASAAPVSVSQGSAVPATWLGIARLPADRVTEGGFDSLSLTARNVFGFIPPNGDRVREGFGRIELESGVHLETRARLEMNAASIGMRGGGGEALVRSSYVGIRHDGASQFDAQALEAAAPVAGEGSLSIEGNFIDLLGLNAITGVSQVTLKSTGDIRGSGLLDSQASRVYRGRLDTVGTLTLEARQIYPSTLADFTFSAHGDDAEVLIRPVAGKADPVLSAGGRLAIEAAKIESSGVLRAPLGTIELHADSISMLAGSLLSTSAEGQIIPFGTTQGGLSWAYRQANGVTRIFGPDGEPLPEQHVVLDAKDVNLASGSTIDVSGGGELLAYEFIKGPGGTTDVLSAQERPNQFAIIPGMNPALAPYDPTESQGVALRAGDSIWLGAGSGVPEGFYTLLPARYALLPGAYLVSAASGYQDIAAGESYAQRSGGVVVAGRRGISGTTLLDDRSTGYLVRKGEDVMLDARYDLSRANELMPRLDTQGNSTRLPRDAGTVSLLATTGLALDGVLRAAIDKEGRGSTLEVSAPSITVVAPGGTAEPGSLAVSASQLSSLGAQTLVIGGRRATTADGEVLTAQAASVTVDKGVTLSSPEVLLVARDLVRVADDAKVEAAGAAFGGAEALELSAGASLLRVSTADQVEVSRSPTGSGVGRLELADGSLVKAPGSITVDVGGSALTAGAFDIGTGSLGLGADRIALGAASDTFTGVVVDADVLGAVRNGTLELNARSGLDLFAGTDLTARNVSITTPVISAADPGVTARISADSLLLRGSDAVSSATAGTGRLDISASSLELGGGTLALAGFETANFAVNGVANITGDGALLGPQNMGLSAGLITGSAGSGFQFQSTGLLTLGAASITQQQLDAAPNELGARIAFRGESIAGSARVRAAAGQVELRAQGAAGNVDLGADTSLDVSGQTVHFGEADVAAPGGRVALTSDSGSISLAAGSRIDVSASEAAGASAGTLSITAQSGTVTSGATLIGGAADEANGGSIELVARDFDFGQMQSALTAGAFTGDWSIWKRGPGDLDVASGTTIRARSATLTADAGAVRVAGTIDASTGRGGHISIAAGGPVEVTGGLDTHATDSDVRGGRIDLFSGTGIVLASGSSLNVSGTALSDTALDPGGTITIRAPRAAFLSVLDGDAGNDALRLDGALVGARRVDLEGTQTYALASNTIGSAEVLADPGNPWFADAAAFEANAPSILQALGVAAAPIVTVRPGVELVTAGDMTLGADWNLFDWRFGADNTIAGALTLRAGGTVRFEGTLSDGFTTASDFALPQTPGDSWSYRISGGAELASANPLATQRGDGAAGDVVVGPGSPGFGFGQRMIRTGTGTIDIAAAGDLVLSNQASVIYTAGVTGPGIDLTQSPIAVLPGFSPFPMDGGNISIDVGRDVVGARTQQMFTDWQYRIGGTDPLPASTAWTVLLPYFEQGIATLGGGNLAVRAGRDVLDLSASTPSIGRQIGGFDLADSVVQATAGGDLSVRAGGTIRGGQYYVDRGVGLLEAGDFIGTPTDSVIAPILALGDSSFALRARGDITVTTAFNPTLIYQTGFAGPAQFPSYFGTYAPDAKLSLVSAGGDVLYGANFSANNGELANAFGIEHPSFALQVPEALTLFSVAPPSLDAVALSGSVETTGPVSMWPAERGNLRLLAGEDVTLGPLLMSDAALGSVLPTPEQPTHNTVRFVPQLEKFTGLPEFYADQPVHSANGGDPDPALIAALTGDVRGLTTRESMFIPKPLHVSAGRDVLNLNAQIQHFAPWNVSTVSAGRDIRYTSERDDSGLLRTNFAALTIDGPGRLELLAARDFDLQTSGGITSNGSLRNSALPDGGADISVTAGLSGGEPAYDAFIDKYLGSIATYDDLLKAYVAKIDGGPPASKEAALARFRELSRNGQRGLLEAVLFAEIRSGGRSAAAAGPTNGNFERAFAALETMFPGSNPDLDAGETNPYQGDIRLYFSRLYTLSGGSINLLAPGGEINVGLATPPTAFGISKGPADLGIVIQAAGNVNALSYSDFQVNESRTFAADGGNILVWSTRGDIDAGRGAKTAISAPPPEISQDENGSIRVNFKAALTGSGIQTLATSEGRDPGDVDLFAPRGVVNAGDAGIVAGNLTIAATAVLGANNIQVSGTSVVPPTETAGLGQQLAPASNVASAASAALASTTDSPDRDKDKEAPLADSALGWLDVFIEGFGEETCKPSDAECLLRQQKR